MTLEDLNKEVNLTASAIEVTSGGSVAPALSSSLGYARNLFDELGAEFTPERKRVQELESRLVSARFHLAVLGQVKRGKSTLLNALIGEELLPSAIVPVTSVPTFLTWGPKRLIKVVFLDGHTKESCFENPENASVFLAQYVTESHNSKNHLGVARVEVEHPSPLLQKGVVLIDTPGIGSTFQHNTEVTLNFLPQCDAALFLVSADPPITQVEIEFLKAVRDKVVRTLFLMNKVDYLSESERLMAIEFFKTVLREQIGLDGCEPIFSISARLGLGSKLKGDESQWAKSGISEVEGYLVKFLSEEKIYTLSLAIARKAADTLGDGLLHLRLKRRSLTLPLEDLEQKLAIFNQKLQEIEHQRELARDLLAGDQRRLIETLEQECANTLKATQAELFRILDETLESTASTKAIEETLHNRLTEVIPALFGGSLSKVSSLVNQRMQEILGSHQEKTNALAETIWRTAAELLEIPYVPGKGNESLVTRHQPYWVTENWSATMSPVPRGFFERLLPRNIAIRRVKRWLQQDIESIVLRNVGNLQYETRQNIEDTFRRFSLDLDQQLDEVAKATLGAIQEAHVQRTQKADSAGQELKRLAGFESKMQELYEKLAKLAA
jgi:GTP-binding protein EngB required for normal cell division